MYLCSGGTRKLRIPRSIPHPVVLLVLRCMVNDSLPPIVTWEVCCSHSVTAPPPPHTLSSRLWTSTLRIVTCRLEVLADKTRPEEGN